MMAQLQTGLHSAAKDKNKPVNQMIFALDVPH